jgi:hypothetical protein
MVGNTDAYEKEHRRIVSENRMPGRIFGPERKEITGGWRKMYSEEIQIFTAFTI